MNSSKNSKKILVICCWIGALIILLIDTKVSLGYIDWLFYIIPVSLLASMISLRTTITSAVTFTVFIIIGGFLSSPETIPLFTSIFNRIGGIFILWFVIFLAATQRQVRVRTEKKELQFNSFADNIPQLA